MSYYFSKKINRKFNATVDKVKEELKTEGFGILTEIDVKETFKKKINVDFHQYKILGACNPQFAYGALKMEDKIGTMLPCNVIVQEISTHLTEVAAINPVSSMVAVENQQLHKAAEEVAEILKRVISRL